MMSQGALLAQPKACAGTCLSLVKPQCAFARRASTPVRRAGAHTVQAVASPVEAPAAAPSNARFSQAEWDAFVAGWTSQYEERAFFVEPGMVEGEIPAELQGTLLRNGPALYEIGGKSIPQPFDGDGMVATFCFPGGGAPPFFANRFVRTQAFVEEQETGKMLYRGAFSVGNPAGGGFYNPFDFSIKKPANTGVVHWAKRLLALYERDMPHELTTPTLATKGPTDCDGAIDGPFFAAHYRIFTEPDGARRLVGFNSAEAGLDNTVTVWEFDEAGNRLHRTNATFPDAAFAFLHDFAMTERSYIFVENPVRMNLGKLLTKYMFGKACIAECLGYDPSRPTKIHVIPRPGRPGSPPPGADAYRTYVAPSPFFSFHHINAWETAEGRIVLDTAAMHEGMDFSANLSSGAEYYSTDVGRGTYTRLVMTPWTGEVAEYKLMDRACEFPSVAPSVVGKPSAHAYMWGARADSKEVWGAPQVLTKVSVDPAAGVGDGRAAARASEAEVRTAVSECVFNPGPRRWAGEPIFVPRPGGEAEDDGWVLAVVFDSDTRRSELAILDARDMRAVATIKMPLMLPAGLHGSWTGEYLGAPPGQPFAPQAHDIRRGVANPN